MQGDHISNNVDPLTSLELLSYYLILAINCLNDFVLDHKMKAENEYRFLRMNKTPACVL